MPKPGKKGKGKGSFVGGQTGKDCLITWAEVWKSPIVGIEPATFRSESAALTTAPRDPTLSIYRQSTGISGNCTRMSTKDVYRRGLKALLKNG